MKEVPKKTLLELISNCKRSDGELAKVLKISQPTVTRVSVWFEKNQLIREYAAIPEFSKIKPELVVFTFFKIRVGATKEALEEIRKKASAFIKNIQTSF